MRRFLLLVLGLAVMLGLSMAAFAQDDPQIVYTGGYQSSYGGFGTGLYSGTLNGTATEFVCDDATHDIGNGSAWYNNAWSLSQVITLGNGMFAGGSAPYATATGDSQNGGSFTVPQAYSAVAYLANLLFTGADPSYINQIQYAIWQIMDNPGDGPGCNLVGGCGLPPQPLTEGDTAYWVNLGKSNDTYTNGNIVFYSPDGNTIYSGPYTGDYPQEFIGETPEPLSMILMGTFLSLAGLALGKKKLF